MPADVSRGSVVWAVALMVVAGAVGCGETAVAPEARLAPTEVSIEDYRFLPHHQFVTPGSLVSWVNRDDVAHMVISGTPEDAGREFESELIRPGETFRHRFETAGRYRYHCALHLGRIRVRGDIPILFVREQTQPYDF